MAMNNQRQPLLNRHFTRTEIVERFLKDFGPPYAEFDQGLVVSSVYLFIEFAQPAWQVNFLVKEQGNTVYVEKEEQGVPVLAVALYLELSKLATSLAEEDEAWLSDDAYQIILRNRGLL